MSTPTEAGTFEALLPDTALYMVGKVSEAIDGGRYGFGLACLEEVRRAVLDFAARVDRDPDLRAALDPVLPTLRYALAEIEAHLQGDRRSACKSGPAGHGQAGGPLMTPEQEASRERVGDVLMAAARGRPARVQDLTADERRELAGYLGALATYVTSMSERRGREPTAQERRDAERLRAKASELLSPPEGVGAARIEPGPRIRYVAGRGGDHSARR
jgi:hypothetical protein